LGIGETVLVDSCANPFTSEEVGVEQTIEFEERETKEVDVVRITGNEGHFLREKVFERELGIRK
jgi:hypothetical protein